MRGLENIMSGLMTCYTLQHVGNVHTYSSSVHNHHKLLECEGILKDTTLTTNSASDTLLLQPFVREA